MNEKEIAKILDENGFEIKFDRLKHILSDVEIRKLAEWVDKYKINLRKYAKMQLDYNQYVTFPAELPEDDPRYDDNDFSSYVLESDAPEEAKDFLNIKKDYEYFGNSLPIIEFPIEALYG